MKRSGANNNNTTFLFTDTQIKNELFVEDINNLLNTGEVPNIFPPEEKAEILDIIRQDATNAGVLETNMNQMFAFFIKRVKKRLHIVLAFSPIGGAMRQRIRQFPSLVNCCTIDWFSEWPADALSSVAIKFLKELEMSDSIYQSCVELCKLYHESTSKWAKDFLKNLGRQYYVTPTS